MSETVGSADAVLERLRRWRSEVEGKPGVEDVLDSDLAQIARSSARTPEAIAAMLPASAAGLADELAQVVADGATAGSAGPHESRFSDTERQRRDSADTQRQESGFHNGARPQADAHRQNDHSHGQDHAPDVDLDALAFAPPDFAPGGDAPHRIETSPGPGGVVLRWPAHPQDSGDGAVVIYRVGSNDSYPPYSPDAADPVAVTLRPRAVDERTFTDAVRVVRVWRHVGDTARDAAATPPVLHAEAAVVAPVQESALAQSENGVVGQWRVLRGTTAVTVLRVPIEQAHRGAGDPRYRILAEELNLGGLHDRTVTPGRRYLYQLVAVAEVDGVPETSAPVNHDIHVQAALAPVDDLAVVLHEGTTADPAANLELRWTPPPAGRVVVYRTADGPEPGATREALAEGGLDQAGLRTEDRLLHQLLDDDTGRAGMDDVAWPEGWHVAHLTPVTLLDGRARVGTPVTVVRVGPVTDLRLVERTSSQALTFGWPDGAAAVRLHRGALDQDPRTATTGSWEEIPHGRYLRDGGMILEEPLAARGCSVHLLGVAFHEGRTYTGPPASQNYGGLLRLRYVVDARRTLRGRLTGLALKIESQLDLPGAPSFVLVHNPDRLPLHVRDGRPLRVAAESADGSTAGIRFSPPVLGSGAPDLTWIADAQGLEGGYVRLFVDLDDDVRMGVALLDPPMSSLRLVANAPWSSSRTGNRSRSWWGRR